MPIKCKVNGAWKDAEAKVKVNNVWKSVESVFVKVNGAWKTTENYSKAYLTTYSSGTLTLKFIEGMSWKTWADSRLNTIGVTYDSERVYYNSNPIGLDTQGFNDVRPNDLITERTYYED